MRSTSSGLVPLLYETNTLCVFLYEKDTVNIWGTQNIGLRIHIYYRFGHFTLSLSKSTIPREELLKFTKSCKKELESIYALHVVKWSRLTLDTAN